MVNQTFHLMSGRRTKRIPYKEDGTVLSETTSQRDTVSAYLPPSSESEDDVLPLGNQPRNKGAYVPKSYGTDAWFID